MSRGYGAFGDGLERLARRDPMALAAVLGFVLIAYFAVPVLLFLSQAGSIGVLEQLAEPVVREAIVTSLVTAPISTAIATVFGVPLAYLLSRGSFRGKRLVEAVVLVPLVVPPVVGGVMLLAVVGQFTPIGGAASRLGVPLTDSRLGIVLAQTFVAAPFLVITARAGFDDVDPALEDAARTLGVSRLGTVRTVSIPLAKNAIGAGIVLTFVRAVGEFGATMMVAYNPRTMPTRIWVSFVSYGVEAVLPVALALLVITVLVVVAVQLLVGTPRS